MNLLNDKLIAEERIILNQSKIKHLSTEKKFPSAFCHSYQQSDLF